MIERLEHDHNIVHLFKITKKKLFSNFDVAVNRNGAVSTGPYETNKYKSVAVVVKKIQWPYMTIVVLGDQ